MKLTGKTKLLTSLIRTAFKNPQVNKVDPTWFRRFDVTAVPYVFSWGLRSKKIDLGSCMAVQISSASKQGKTGTGPETQLLFFHGGGYTSGPILIHWKFLTDLCRHTKMPVLSPIYSKSPEHPYPTALKEAEAAYIYLQKQHPEAEIIIGGDSAGGNLALELYLKLKKSGKVCPKKIFLISPWLDLSLSNPAISRLEKHEPLLNHQQLVQMGKDYLQGSQQDLYKEIPFFKDVKILLITGTHDILYPDCRRFYRVAKEQGKKLEYHEYSRLFHDFSLWTSIISEADQAFKQITRFITAQK